MSSRDFDASPEDSGFGEGSRFAAHLDRGWENLEKGDVQAARSSATHAEKLQGDSPDVALLLAAIAIAEGDGETGLAYYDRALERDSDYVDAHLAACQVLLYDLGDPEACLERARAIDRVEGLTAQESVDAWLIRLESLAALAREAESTKELERGLVDMHVTETLTALLRGPETGVVGRGEYVTLLSNYVGELEEEPDDQEIEDLLARVVTQTLRLARLQIDAGHLDDASALLRESSQHADEDADYWYLLNEVEHRLGNMREAVRAALRVYQLDASAEDDLELPTAEELDETLRELITGHVSGPSALAHSHEIPTNVALSLARMRDCMPREGVVIIVHELPSPELVLEGADPRALVLALGPRSGGPGAAGFTSSEQAENPSTPPGACLTGIAVYRRNLARINRGQGEILGELASHLAEELTAFFGEGQSRDDKQVSDDRLAANRRDANLGPLESNTARSPRLDDDDDDDAPMVEPEAIVETSNKPRKRRSAKSRSSKP